MLERGRLCSWVAMNMCELLWALFLSRLHTVLLTLFICYGENLPQLVLCHPQTKSVPSVMSTPPSTEKGGKELSKYLKAVARHELVAVRAELSIPWPKQNDKTVISLHVCA